MIIFCIKDKIVGYIPNNDLTEERKEEILTTNPNAIWIENENINPPDTTKQYAMYYIDGAIEYVEIAEKVVEPTQLDRIEEQVNSIANGTTAENTDAINALLGV